MTNISSQLYSSWVWCVCGGGGVSLGEAIPDDVKTCPECFCDYTYQQNEERSYFWCVWKQIGKSRRTKINLLKVSTGMCIYRLFERDKGKVCMYVLLKLYLIHVNNSPSSAPPSCLWPQWCKQVMSGSAAATRQPWDNKPEVQKPTCQGWRCEGWGEPGSTCHH